MTSMTIYQKVAAGELSPDEGADALMAKRASTTWSPKQPTWMPRWLYLVALVLGYIVLAPILSSRDKL